MVVEILNGKYKGCVCETFLKGADRYFRDDEDSCDVLLKNYDYKTC